MYEKRKSALKGVLCSQRVARPPFCLCLYLLWEMKELVLALNKRPGIWWFIFVFVCSLEISRRFGKNDWWVMLWGWVTGFEICSTKTLCVDPVWTNDVRYLRLAPQGLVASEEALNWGWCPPCQQISSIFINNVVTLSFNGIKACWCERSTFVHTQKTSADLMMYTKSLD